MIEEQLMRRVIELAEQAKSAGELPMAALLVKDGQILHHSLDKSIALSDPTAHAEQQLIREYCQANQLISLEGCELYTLVEPCVMCAGAIKWAKIDRVVFSLSQQDLQTKSGGRPKPSCEEMVNTGGRRIAVTAGILITEARQVYANYQFPSKKELHRRHYNEQT